MNEKILGKRLLDLGVKTKRRDRVRFIKSIPSWDKLTGWTLKTMFFTYKEVEK